MLNPTLSLAFLLSSPCMCQATRLPSDWLALDAGLPVARQPVFLCWSCHNPAILEAIVLRYQSKEKKIFSIFTFLNEMFIVLMLLLIKLLY